jgi:L-2,4-diaminobutyrate decarboxylase
MLAEGKALLAGTKIDGRIWLKLTVLNPRTTIEHMRTILNDVSRAGRAQLALLHPIVQPAGQGA